MKTVLATLALVVPVLAFVAWDAPAQNGSQQGNRTNYKFYMPERWWTDQDSDTARCERYPDGPFHDRLRAECIAKAQQR